MNAQLEQRLFDQLNDLVLIDPHTHINPHKPASETLADILGYHYYTELAHSAGMPREHIEQPGISPKEKVGRLVEGLGHIDNTAQLAWLVDLSRDLFDFTDDRIDSSNWEKLYDTALAKMQHPDWESRVLTRTGLQSVFLTNDFDDPLTGFNTERYIPCLRTDDLVFHFAKSSVRERLAKCTGRATQNLGDLRQSIGHLFQHFTKNGARACAISLPPWFTPIKIDDSAAESALRSVLSQGEAAGIEDRQTLGYWIFWHLATNCVEFKLPFDLMIGVNRAVYPAGVYQGQDLYDSRVSLIQYKDLLNAFPQIMFPISVLASVTNQELVSYSWIFPNVITHGHWWYSNTPSFITRDLQARMEAIPRNKQIGYYSDMYKLEFALPKFKMFKRCLARVLANHFVLDNHWSEERAIALGHQILRGNVETVFNVA